MRTRQMVIGLATAVLSAGAQGAAFQNGSFEAGVSLTNYLALPGDSTAITGWTVGGSSSNTNVIDYIGSYWTAQDGSRSIDLDGFNTAGSIFQAFDTAIGQAYRVDFWLAGNPDSGAAVKSVQVAAAGTSADYSFDTTGRTKSAMGWVMESFSFIASATSTTLSFTSLCTTGCSWGPAIDNVSVTAVPEASTYAMLLAGLGLMGFLGRRRMRT